MADEQYDDAPQEQERERKRWRDLTDAQADQVDTDRGRHVKFLDNFEGKSLEAWLSWFEDLESAFRVKKITSPEAMIYLAFLSMTSALRKEAETLKSSWGRSWEDFKAEIERNWAIDTSYGSLEALRRVVKEFRIL